MERTFQQKSGKPNATNQVSKSLVAADRVEIGMGFEELQDIGLLFVGLLEPVEGLFVVAKAQVSVHERGSRNIACLPALFQVREEPQRIGAPTGVGVRSDQDAGCGRTSRKRNGLFQKRDCICRLIVGNQWKSKACKIAHIVRL